MALRNDVERYGSVAKLLHWTMAALILAQLPLALYMVSLPLSLEKAELYNLHKSFGLTLLLLAIARLLWRRISPPPPLPEGMPDWERAAAHVSHAALYLLMFAQPLFGLVHSFASGFPTIIYGLFSLPSPIAANQALTDVMKAAHFWTGVVLFALVGLHVAAALRHHFVVKDQILRRMLFGAP